MTTTSSPLVTHLRSKRSAPTQHAYASSGRRDVVLGLALVTTVVEILCYYGNTLPSIRVGDFTISGSTVPGLALAAACGRRLFGRSSTRRAALSFWIATALAMTAFALAYADLHRLIDVPALVLAAFDEELVYRLAAPAVIAFALRRFVPAPSARIAGLAMAGLWFVLLPGHREQMTSPALAIPFIAYATLSAIVVYRSGSIIPMAVTHATSNLLTILMWNDALAGDVRSMGVTFVVVLLIVAYGRHRPVAHGDRGGLVDIRTGLPLGTIDLRDPPSDPAAAPAVVLLTTLADRLPIQQPECHAGVTGAGQPTAPVLSDRRKTAGSRLGDHTDPWA